MKKIFKNAKFGDKYRTRDGRMAIYLGADRCWIENELSWDAYFDNGAWLVYGDPNNKDIVGKWQEPIDEKELDRLAEEYFHSLSRDNGVMANFKAGYRKAMNKEI